MPKKITDFKDTTYLLRDLGGEEALELIKLCQNKKDVTDEYLAKKMSLKITQVRTVLNRLHYRGIACYTKTKDKNTGWYHYRWMIKEKRVAELILERYLEELTKLERASNMEETYMFFACKNGCDRIPFEIAAEYHFRCPNCGEEMDANNNQSQKGFNRKINQLKKDISELNEIIK